MTDQGPAAAVPAPGAANVARRAIARGASCNRLGLLLTAYKGSAGARAATTTLHNEGGTLKILVVDDHALIREAMQLVLRQLDANIEVLEAGNCADALAAADRHPDLGLILLDIQLPGMSGLDALGTFRERHPAIPVVVLSGSENRDDVMRAIDGGAMGFIPKSQPSSVMINALRLVLAGGVYLPVEILGVPAAASSSPAAGTERTPAELGLTRRQSDVLALLIQGKPNKIICRELGLAEGTVKIHVTAILRALGVANRTQAVIAVSRLGLKLGGLGNRPPDAGGA
jgi:DNA-binding NarL/FixJ family response regulator